MSGSLHRLDRFATTFDHEGLVANAGLILAGTLMARLGVLGLIERWVHTGLKRPGFSGGLVVSAAVAAGGCCDGGSWLRVRWVGRGRSRRGVGLR